MLIFLVLLSDFDAVTTMNITGIELCTYSTLQDFPSFGLIQGTKAVSVYNLGGFPICTTEIIKKFWCKFLHMLHFAWERSWPKWSMKTPPKSPHLNFLLQIKCCCSQSLNLIVLSSTWSSQSCSSGMEVLSGLQAGIYLLFILRHQFNSICTSGF